MRGAWTTSAAAVITGGCFYYFGSLAQLTTWLAGCYAFNVLTIFGVHIQHTFNPGYCRRAEGWSPADSALLGSSYHSTIGLGWFFLGVEHHSLHHFAPWIPVYKLRSCYRAAQCTLWSGIERASFLSLVARTRLALYSEGKGCYQSFRDLHDCD